MDLKLTMSYDEYAEIEAARIKEAAEAEGKELKESNINKKVARNFMKMVISDEENMEELEDIKEALVVLFKGRTRSGEGRTRTASPKASIRNAIKEVLSDEGSISEQDVFTKSVELGNAWGRAEMKKFIKDCINVNPDERIWVSLKISSDSPMGEYVVEGTGADVPADWEGYVPAETAIDL